MRFKLILLFLPFILIGLFACNSEKGYIETVVEEGSPGTIVHTDWSLEKQQASKIAKKKLPTATKKSAEKNSQPHTEVSKNSFHLQLGAFVNEANAKSLIKQVEKMGYQPFIEDSISKGKKWHFVKVGPFRQKNQAVYTANKLTPELKTDIMVLKNKTLIESIQAPQQPKFKKKVIAAKTIQSPKATEISRTKNEPKKSPPQKKQTASNKSEKQISVEKLPKKFKSKADPKANEADSPYSFQIGGLFTLENAKKQVLKFQQLGYSPYLVTVDKEINNERWYSVRIGRFKTMKDAVDEATIFSIKEQIPTKPQPINY